MTFTEAASETLKRMRKGTIMQRLDIADCKTATAKTRAWMNVGFTACEAQGMVKGEGFDKPDGIWQVGEVPYPQAISKIHAQKIHIWNFGEVEETQLIKTDAQGLKWVLE